MDHLLLCSTTISVFVSTTIRKCIGHNLPTNPVRPFADTLSIRHYEGMKKLSEHPKGGPAERNKQPFLRAATRRPTEDILKERIRFTFTADEWHVLTDKLDAPISSGERRKVAKLLAETPMWTP